MSTLFMHRILPMSLLLLLVFLTWWINTKVQPDIRKANQALRHDPDYIMENFEATSMDLQGNLQYLVKASKMTHYPDDDSTELELPFVMVYVDTVPTWQLRSERGIFKAKSEEVFLQGTVTANRLATEEQGEIVISTSNITITRANMLGETGDPVTITEQHGVTRAKGMRLYLDEKRLELLSEVRGSYVAAE